MGSEFEIIDGDRAILPYSPKGGVVSQDHLLGFLQRMKDESLFDIVFHENPEMTPFEFLSFFNSPRNLLQVFALRGDEALDPIGMAWLSEVTNCGDVLTRGTGSFVFFKDYQKPEITDYFGKRILRYWFEVLGLETIVGVTPEANRAAMVYIRRLGFQMAGRVPAFTSLRGESCGVIVTYFTRSDWGK